VKNFNNNKYLNNEKNFCSVYLTMSPKLDKTTFVHDLFTRE